MTPEKNTRDLRTIVAAAGFDLSVNQAGPLLEQMMEWGDVSLVYDDGQRWVHWCGFCATGETLYIAALKAIASWIAHRSREQGSL